MDISGLKTVLLERSNSLRENGATGLYIFGSRAKGDNRPDSDLDLFIDYESQTKIPSLLKILEFQRVVGDEIGIPIHLTTRRSLHPLMKSEIERTAIRVF